MLKCPCALLIVTAYDNLTENCIILKSKCKSLGIIGMRGIGTVWPTAGPVKTIATIILLRRNFNLIFHTIYRYYYYKSEEFVKAYHINNNYYY